jgi:transcriptional regulator
MGFMGGDRQPSWKITDAPDRYIDLMLRNIVGIEIQVHKLEGKFKMSQEMRKGDRDGDVHGLSQMQTEAGTAVSLQVEKRGLLKDAKKGGKA